MRDVTRPVTLKIHTFKCIPHPLFKRELCGADASATFNRDDFGLDAGKPNGFRMEVGLRIQVETLMSSLPNGPEAGSGQTADRAYKVRRMYQ